MKKIILFSMLISAVGAQAQNFQQDYKPFKVNLSLGYVHTTVKGLPGGGLISLEPKYAISPRTDLGLRLEAAVMTRGLIETGNGNISKGSTSGVGSYVLTGTHYFSRTNTRPFLGLGLGYYQLSSAGNATVSNSSGRTEIPVVSYQGIGGLFRAGVKTGHLVFSVEYNALPEHIQGLNSSAQLTSSQQEFRSRGSYAGFKLGIDFGGGPIR